MKWIIAGTRKNLTLTQRYFVRESISKLMHSHAIDMPDTILSGGATGVDSYGEELAREWGFKVVVCGAKWTEYGNKAGPIRNRQMAAMADFLIAFPLSTEISKGTRDVIEQMAKLRKPHLVLYLPAD